MNRFMLKHLLWVLWLWLLLVGVLSEDGVTSKSEKHLVIKQESGPKGDSLVRSFVSTRVSRAFTSTRSFDDGRITDKPPDDRQSTIRLRNETVDLSKNTVPVLKYPVPTESSLKEKYRKTTEGPETTPLKKSLKFKRNMTRSRPSDLTTLLVYNALTPGRYPSTTQVAESMPPTAWALATLKVPGSPSLTNVKPFASWSTRLSRPSTPSPITDVTDLVTEYRSTVQPQMSGIDITSPGNQEVGTSALSNEGTSTIPNFDIVTFPITTEKPEEVTAFKPEENTISVPPLASFKNTTIDHESSDLPIHIASELPKYATDESILKRNDSIFSSEMEQKNFVTTEENKNKTTSFILPTEAMIRLNTKTIPEDISKINKINSSSNLKLIDNSIKKVAQEVDPSINTINEKKHEDQLSTSTVLSTINSTVSVHVTPLFSTTSKSSNLTNVIDVDQMLSGDEYEFSKKLHLAIETTTLVPHSSSPETIDKSSSLNEANHTNNDIKLIAKNNEITPMSSDVTLETPSTQKTNEIKPEPVSTNTIKNNNLTEFQIESFHNYVQELSETTQSNDIQVHDKIKPVNKTSVQHFKKENSSESQKSLENATSFSSHNPASTYVAVINSTLSTITTITEDNLNNFTTMNNEMITLSETSIANKTSLSNDDLLTLPPVTTTLPIITMTPKTVVDSADTISRLPSTSVNTQSSFSPEEVEITTIDSPITIATTTDTPVSTTTKSNQIMQQDVVTELHQLPPEVNTTNFELFSRNSVKNDTLLVFRDEDDDDETLQYNNTEISDKKGPPDNINNNENDDDSDDSLETTINGSIPVTIKQVSKEAAITSVPVIIPPSVKPTTIVSDDATIIDEDHTMIDDDSLYDTGVIMTIYIRLVIEATYHELCKNKELLKDAIVKVFKNYTERTISRRQVMITNLGINDCSGFRGEREPRLIPVNLMLTNSQGQYDKSLNDLFISLAKQKNINFKYPISQVERVQLETSLETESLISGTMVAAIIISSIAAVCLFALTVLLVIMRKRQTGFNYGQRCTPVSLDDYSLDNISVYNSVRRKAIRASKRSYGNPAFDDPDTISNPVNFAGLANMASDKSKTDEEFSSLPQVVVKPDELPLGAEIKNRYANVIPIPETRVQLRSSSPEDQFINANYVKGAKGAEKFYIACQAPLQNTIKDFWRMIWDEQSRLIIMLTDLTENGVEKCANYLPPSEVLDCHRVFGDLQVTLKKREEREKYVISSLQLKNLETNLWREVTHMWFAGWPPTGVPLEPSSVIAFLIEARSYSKSSPIVVHCSPGTGRTGTVIAIDIAIRDFEAGRSVDIPKTVIELRRGRAGAVQTKDQYSFIYKVLHLYATKLTGGGLDSI